MAKRVAPDRPMSFEEVGVIGAVDDAVLSDVQAPLSDGEARAAARPADASPVEGAEKFLGSGFAKKEPEPEQEEERLPDGFESWPGFKLANASARDNFENAVIFPGNVFIAGGRYVNVRNVSEVFDVMPDEVVPEGLYLLGVNYLVSSRQRDRILRGDVKPAKAQQPDPLRSKE